MRGGISSAALLTALTIGVVTVGRVADGMMMSLSAVVVVAVVAIATFGLALWVVVVVVEMEVWAATLVAALAGGGGATLTWGEARGAARMGVMATRARRRLRIDGDIFWAGGVDGFS